MLEYVVSWDGLEGRGGGLIKALPRYSLVEVRNSHKGPQADRTVQDCNQTRNFWSVNLQLLGP